MDGAQLRGMTEGDVAVCRRDGGACWRDAFDGTWIEAQRKAVGRESAWTGRVRGSDEPTGRTGGQDCEGARASLL